MAEVFCFGKFVFCFGFFTFTITWQMKIHRILNSLQVCSDGTIIADNRLSIAETFRFRLIDSFFHNRSSMKKKPKWMHNTFCLSAANVTNSHCKIKFSFVGCPSFTLYTDKNPKYCIYDTRPGRGGGGASGKVCLSTLCKGDNSWYICLDNSCCSAFVSVVDNSSYSAFCLTTGSDDFFISKWEA